MRPAIDVGLSVSRVGSSAQTKPMKKNAGKMKLAMAQYRELESFAQFDSDLDPETKKTIERGKRTAEMLKQVNGSPLRVALQVASIYAVNNGFLDHVHVTEVTEWERELHEKLEREESDLLKQLDMDWNESIERALKEVLEAYHKHHETRAK